MSSTLTFFYTSPPNLKILEITPLANRLSCSSWFHLVTFFSWNIIMNVKQFNDKISQ